MDKIIWTSHVSHGDQGLLYPGRVFVVGVDVPLEVAEKWVKQGAADVYTEPVSVAGEDRPKERVRRKK